MPYDTPILPALGTVPMLAVMVVAGLRVIARTRVAPSIVRGPEVVPAA